MTVIKACFINTTNKILEKSQAKEYFFIRICQDILKCVWENWDFSETMDRKVFLLQSALAILYGLGA